MSHWLSEGRKLGESLRRFTSIVVAGSDPDATADVALGIAEVQAEHRRVVLGDLLGDAARFAAFRIDDDHHGLADVFHYGVSLERITRPVAGTDRLDFAPTGSEIPDYAEILGHPRWKRLTASFADSQQLLVIAVPLHVRGLDDLVVRTDGAVIVDGLAPAELDGSRVIATVRPAPVPPPPPAPPLPAEKRARRSSAQAGRTSSVRRSMQRVSQVANAVSEMAASTEQALRRPVNLTRTIVVGLSGFAVVVYVAYWLATRPFAEGRYQQPPEAAVPRTIAISRAGPSNPNALDPVDSGSAAYAVQIISANTQAAAILRLQVAGRSFPAATYAPVTIQSSGTTWYKVVAGAFTTRGGADSLLISLRHNGLLDSTEGIVVRVPYALRMDKVPDDATTDVLANLQTTRRLPVYALHQSDGTAWILVGAFETASEADLYSRALRSDGLTPELVHRQGRMF